MPCKTVFSLRPLEGIRILSIALNIPGPAALMRSRRLGASCVKVEPPDGDPLKTFFPSAYDDLHDGINVYSLDLKTSAGRKVLDDKLDQVDIFLTSFRPSALD